MYFSYSNTCFIAIITTFSFLLKRRCANSSLRWYFNNAFNGLTFSPSEVIAKSVKPKSIPIVLIGIDLGSMVCFSQQNDTKYLLAQSLLIVTLSMLLGKLLYPRSWIFKGLSHLAKYICPSLIRKPLLVSLNDCLLILRLKLGYLARLYSLRS